MDLPAKGSYAYQYIAPFGRPPVLGEVEAGTVAARAGLEKGDFVLEVGGGPVGSWPELQQRVQESKGSETEIRIRRGEEEKVFPIVPAKGADGRYYIQVKIPEEAEPVLGEVVLGSPADRSGFKSGDRITAVCGVSVSNWRRLDAEVHRAAARGGQVEVSVRRGGAELTLPVETRAHLVASLCGHGLGISTCAAWMNCRSPFKQLESDASGIFRILKALVTPRQSKATGKALGGPVMIAQGIYASVRSDFWSGLGFLRYLNVNLAILNLMPIPVLDGGLILFAFIALVFRRRVPEKVVGSLSMAFMVLLLAAMAFLMWRDSVRWVKTSARSAETIDYRITDHALEN